MDSKKKIIRIMIVVGVVIVGVVALYVGSIFMGGGSSQDDQNKTATEEGEENQPVENTGITPVKPGSPANAVRLTGEDIPTDVLASEYINRKVLAFEVNTINGTLYFVDAENYKVYKRGNADVVEEPRELGQIPGRDYDEIRFVSMGLSDKVTLVLRKGRKYEFFDVAKGELKTLINEASAMKMTDGKIYVLKDGGTKDSEIWYVTSSGEYPKMVLKKANIRFFEVNSGAILYDDGRKLFRYDLMKKEDFVVLESVVRPRYSLSPSRDSALIQDKGVTFIYRFDKTKDTSLNELTFVMDPVKAFWSLDGKQIYNIKDKKLYRYDVEKKVSNSWNIITGGYLNDDMAWDMKYGTQQMTAQKEILYISYGRPNSLLMIRVLDAGDMYEDI
jgi:hypothetical protein